MTEIPSTLLFHCYDDELFSILDRIEGSERTGSFEGHKAANTIDLQQARLAIYKECDRRKLFYKK